METWSSIKVGSALFVIRHPEVRALARLEGRRPELWPHILRGSLRSHLRMTDRTVSLRRVLQPLQRFEDLLLARHGRVTLLFFLFDDLFRRVGYEFFVAEF